MYQMLIYGFIIGVGMTLLAQDLYARVESFKDRKQREFEAAVKAEASFRKAQADRDWERILTEVGDKGWSHVEPTDNPRHPSNVRAFKDPYA